jgi:chemotaxis protein CheZ
MNALVVEAPATLKGTAMKTATPVDMFQQLGTMTRELHDTLTELGVMASLQDAAAGLPDARSRLGYIAVKTGDAATKVLDLVDRAQRDRAVIARATRALAAGEGDVVASAAAIESAGARIDAHLIDIMVAQDFHDLTSQVVAKVLTLASNLEASLLKVLVQSAPDHRARLDPAALNGPVVDFDKRTDVVANQGEVDDLLASLGF